MNNLLEKQHVIFRKAFHGALADIQYCQYAVATEEREIATRYKAFLLDPLIKALPIGSSEDFWILPNRLDVVDPQALARSEDLARDRAPHGHDHAFLGDPSR